MAKNDAIISPSILGAKWWELRRKLKILKALGATYIHFDVMNGTFVPEKSFNEKKIKQVSRFIKSVYDVHLMIDVDEDIIKKYAKSGADIITIHYEAFNNEEKLLSCLKEIRNNGCKAGISIKPITKLSVLEKFLPYIDLVLIMSVEPGKGGQKFMESTYSKIARAKQKIVESHYDIKIEVDGGINDTNAKKIIESGADILVVGSYLFKAKNIEENMAKLCSGLHII